MLNNKEKGTKYIYIYVIYSWETSLDTLLDNDGKP